MHCLCSPDIELLVVSLCPYYLPREFTCAIVIAVVTACDIICSVTARRQRQHPNAFKPSLVISTTLLSLMIYPLFTNLSPAQPEIRKHWTYFMQTLRMHTTPLHYPHLGTPITTWYFSPINTPTLINSRPLEPEL